MNPLIRTPVTASLLLAASLLFTGALAACGDNGSGGGGLPVGEPPDVAGDYQVTLGGTTGCEGASGWINDWATGPLGIDGTNGSLTFDFYDGMVFDGSVDSLGRYQFTGTVTYNKAQLDVSNEGQFEIDPDFDGERWLLTGDFSVVVDDDEFTGNNCTITGPVQAIELVGF
ncbi:MAG: hypothetical protein GXP62_10030 [Oligoflexia bacterium]|nr:hypothetical protein [Oligoflexia bacterium]